MSEFIKISECPRRLFVVGDIHGCLEESAALVEHLRTEEDLGQEDLVVFVGDYVDRGPRSKGVIEYLLGFQQEFPKTIFLKGNHEDMLLSFMGFPGNMGSSYLANGGLQTLQSYGFFQDVPADEALSRMPEEHIRFFERLEHGVLVQNAVIVHAGLNPLATLEEQTDEDLFWIRDEFIVNIHRFGLTVIFGHTPYRDVLFDLPYKVGIDTGLVYGNKLSCIELVEGRILQVMRGNRKVEISSFEDKGGSKFEFSEAAPPEPEPEKTD